MNTNDLFGQELSTWLREEGEHRVPDHLREVLVRTAATRQRPWWSSPERWLPMQATARFSPAVPRVGWLVVVLALVLALIAAALLAGVGRTPLPAPFGPARNGDFVFAADGDIFKLDLSSGARTPLITGPGWDFGAGFSRDGTRLAFGRLAGDPAAAPSGTDPGMVVALANPDGSHVRELTPFLAGNCWSDWSPNGHEMVFRTQRQDLYGVLNVLNLDDGTIRTIDPGISVRCGSIGYRAPDGGEIVFRGDGPSAHGVFAIHPDGTGFRKVNTERPICDCDTGGLSPDGRLLAVDRWNDAGIVQIWLLDLDRGTERLLPMPSGQFARGGTFSPDGSLIAFPRLHEVAPKENAYQIALSPVDGSTTGRALGPVYTLPANGSDEAFTSIAFSPDGANLVVAYPDAPNSPGNAIWLLPVDGSPGRMIGRGTFASLDIQRRAP